VQGFWAYRQDWMGDWANGFQTHLNNCFSQANSDSKWVDNQHLNHLKQYGYTTMMFLELNHSGDWP
jgi:hypothetical protein